MLIVTLTHNGRRLSPLGSKPSAALSPAKTNLKLEKETESAKSAPVSLAVCCAQWFSLLVVLHRFQADILFVFISFSLFSIRFHSFFIGFRAGESENFRAHVPVDPVIP